VLRSPNAQTKDHTSLLVHRVTALWDNYVLNAV
jgi:hypothetical protein